MDEINGRVTNKDLHQALRKVHNRIDGLLSSMQVFVQGQSQTNNHLASLDGRLGQLREASNDALHEMGDRVETLERPWKLLGNGWVAFVAGSSIAVGATTLLLRLGAWPF